MPADGPAWRPVCNSRAPCGIGADPLSVLVALAEIELSLGIALLGAALQGGNAGLGGSVWAASGATSRQAKAGTRNLKARRIAPSSKAGRTSRRARFPTRRRCRQYEAGRAASSMRARRSNPGGRAPGGRWIASSLRSLQRRRRRYPHTSKKTVSPSPCRRMSKMKAPSGPRWAISVPRRPAGTSASTGSDSFAGSSAK